MLEGPKKGIFTIVRNDTFDITAGAFLSSGALLLPERSFNRAEGVKMRLRKVDVVTVSKGNAVDGDILLEAGINYQIDNIECLDAWVDNQGRQRISLTSDDNLSTLQRNLFLEFILTD